MDIKLLVLCRSIILPVAMHGYYASNINGSMIIYTSYANTAAGWAVSRLLRRYEKHMKANILLVH